MPITVSEIQATPNPNALKFILDAPVSDQSMSFFNAEAARGHALAGELFAIPGVAGLLLLGDFITVNKSPDSNWTPIKKRVRQVLAAQGG